MNFSLPAGRISYDKARGGQVTKIVLLPSGLYSLLIFEGGEVVVKLGRLLTIALPAG